MDKIIIIKSSIHGNFGDAITNSFLMSKIAGQKVRLISMHSEAQAGCLGCGSILRFATDKDAVWGTGFMRISDKCLGNPKIYAVRGKLTRKMLLAQGVKCPEIFGDPVLLYPRFYYPKVEKKYKLGIIPHYIDKDNPNILRFREKDILIIDIMTGYQNVIQQVLSCEKIISSGLHGIVIADAYSIPAMWIKFSEKVLGEGFKFRDYFSSVNRKDISPLVITETTTLKDIYNIFYDYKIDIDLDKLYNSCPFRKKNGELS